MGNDNKIKDPSALRLGTPRTTAGLAREYTALLETIEESQPRRVESPRKRRIRKNELKAAEKELARLGELLKERGIDLADLTDRPGMVFDEETGETRPATGREATGRPDRGEIRDSGAQFLEGPFQPQEPVTKRHLLEDLIDRAKKDVGRDLNRAETNDIQIIVDAVMSGDPIARAQLSDSLQTPNVRNFLKETAIETIQKDTLGLPMELGAGPEAPDAPKDMTFDEALYKAAVRYLVANKYDQDLGRNVTEADIEANKSKYKDAIGHYIQTVKSAMQTSPDWGHFEGAGETANRVKVGWVKANLWLEEDGEDYRFTDQDDDAENIRKFRRLGPDYQSSFMLMAEDVETGERVPTQISASGFLDGVKNDINVNFELHPGAFGLADRSYIKVTRLEKDLIERTLVRTAIHAGADLTSASVQEWIKVNTDNIYLESLKSLGEPDAMGMLPEDKTKSWTTMASLIQDLDTTPETIVSEGLRLMESSDKDRYVAAFIREDPAMQEQFTPLELELIATAGFNQFRSEWIRSRTNETFIEWFGANAGVVAPQILQTQKDLEGGLGTPEGRGKFFMDMARATDWAGAKIFTDSPTPFEERTMGRAFHEAEQEYINRGEIPGSWEEILQEKFDNWGEVVRKSTATDQQTMGAVPPGFKPDIALAEGLTRMEARIGGEDLKEQITAGAATITRLQTNLNNLKQSKVYAEQDPYFSISKAFQTQLGEAQTLLNDATTTQSNYQSQLQQRETEIGLHKQLIDDAQLATAFASGNRTSLLNALADRGITDDDKISEFIEMQGRSGLTDMGLTQVASPEQLAAEQKQRAVDAARTAAATIRFDAEGNRIGFDPAQDTFNVRTGVRTDSEGNVIEANPENMIPGTDLPDTQANRDSIAQGRARPGTRQGEGVDEEGRPIVAPDVPVEEAPMILGSYLTPPVQPPPETPVVPPPPPPPGAQPDTSWQEPEYEYPESAPEEKGWPVTEEEEEEEETVPGSQAQR